jgi:hypothetical protein
MLMGTSKNSFSMTRSRFPLGNIRLRRADLRPCRGEDGTTRHHNKSANSPIIRHFSLLFFLGLTLKRHWLHLVILTSKLVNATFVLHNTRSISWSQTNS